MCAVDKIVVVAAYAIQTACFGASSVLDVSEETLTEFYTEAFLGGRSVRQIFMACHIEIGAGFDQSNGGSQKLT
jgi:hypothetical protein